MIDQQTVIEQQLAVLLHIESLLERVLQQQTTVARTLSILVGSAQHGRSDV